MTGLIQVQLYTSSPVLLWSYLELHGYINKTKHWLKFSLYSGLLNTLSIVCKPSCFSGLLHSESPAYVNTRETGFFPENLLTMYPIVPASFIDVQIVLTVFTNFTGTNYFLPMEKFCLFRLPLYSSL